MVNEHLIADIEGDVQAYFDALGVAIDKQMVVALLQAATHAEGALKQEISDTFSSGGTGELARNPKATLLNTDGNVKSAGAFLDLIYARIQDEGGIIRPKNAKALAVPISAKAKKTVGLWPRHWPAGQLEFIPRKGRPPLLVEQQGSWRKLGRSGAKEFVAKKFVIHYVLKKSVTIHGKGYTARAARAAEKVIEEILGDNIGLSIKNTEMPA